MGNCKSANTSPLIICVDGSLEGRRADVATGGLASQSYY
jgi:hypothetical protein